MAVFTLFLNTVKNFYVGGPKTNKLHNGGVATPYILRCWTIMRGHLRKYKHSLQLIQRTTVSCIVAAENFKNFSFS